MGPVYLLSGVSIVATAAQYAKGSLYNESSPVAGDVCVEPGCDIVVGTGFGIVGETQPTSTTAMQKVNIDLREQDIV
jgi:hypothetical protein